MSAGDITVFAAAKLTLGKSLVDLSSDTLKLGLIDSTTSPTETDSDPRWGSAGSTDLSTNEVTAGGNYTTGGSSLTSVTWTLATATATFDAADVSISQDASNPTTARWGIIYDSTDTGKRAIAFLDLGSTLDLTSGDLTITWNASGLFTLA